MLSCPVCRSDMTGLTCACGEVFETDGGTPRLISPRSKASVTYCFASADSVVGDDFYSALSYPPRAAVAANGPYHLDAAHQLVLEQASGRVLEIGCGGGQMRKWVQSRGMEYVGVDISKTRIGEDLQAHGGPDYLADAHFLPFRDASFNVVYSAAVTEHIADPHLMMSEVKRVLKPGGVYMGNGSFLEPWHDDSYYHQSPLGAYRSLVKAGFSVRHVYPGKGYTGFHGLFGMGNKLTRQLRFTAPLLGGLHRLALTLRRKAKRPDPKGGEIAWDGIIAGAVDWIAVKAHHAS